MIDRRQQPDAIPHAYGNAHCRSICRALNLRAVAGAFRPAGDYRGLKMKSMTGPLAIVLALWGAAPCAIASPLTESISTDLVQRDMQIKSLIDEQKFCDARKMTDAAIADFDTAISQTADGQPVNMSTIKSIHAVASPDDIVWIIQRKNELSSAEHGLLMFCPKLD